MKFDNVTEEEVLSITENYMVARSSGGLFYFKTRWGTYRIEQSEVVVLEITDSGKLSKFFTNSFNEKSE